MTRPRVTTSPTDALGATLSDSKGRLSNLEALAHRHDQPSSALGPIGTIVDYIGTTAPTGWAVLDGSTITGGQTLYPALWAILPASFKSGANIVLPDTRGRVAVGRNPSDTDFDNVGDTGGAKTVTLTTAQMPSHRHTQDAHGHGITDPNHTHSQNNFGTNPNDNGGVNGFVLTGASADTSGGARGLSTVSTGVTVNSATATNQDTGGGGSHDNLQPFITFVKIMKLS